MKALPQRRGRGRTLAAFALGATAGGILALLFAPASGRVTRQRLAMGVRKLQRLGVRRLGQTTKLIANKGGHVREAASEWITEHVTNGKHVVRHRA